MNIHERITAHILANVDEAGAWKPCWRGASSPRPINAVSGHTYRGSNILTCWVSAMVHGFERQQWASYKQWQSRGAQVRKGETGTPIIYYSQTTSDNPDEDGKAFARGSYVFNIAQVDGAEAEFIEPTPLDEASRIAVLEEWRGAIELIAMIEHSNAGQAYYQPSTDQIVLPQFSMFETPEHYYSVMFHELVHWTGAKHRLDREFRRERADIAKEELVAEIGAAFLAAQYGLENVTRDDHLSYIKSWMKALNDDKRLILRAASLASAATDYLEGIVADRFQQMRETA